MLILYKNDRNVRFVLFTKTSNSYINTPLILLFENIAYSLIVSIIED